MKSIIKKYIDRVLKELDDERLERMKLAVNMKSSGYLFDVEVPRTHFTINHVFDAKDFAPGVWAGTEGLKMQVTKVDLVTRTITLEVIK